jgi:hypothetical protein
MRLPTQSKPIQRACGQTSHAAGKSKEGQIAPSNLADAFKMGIPIHGSPVVTVPPPHCINDYCVYK